MKRIYSEIELDNLANIFIEHNVLDRKNITFYQFVKMCEQGKMKEILF